jgi:DNA-nicking Smr family endonuclease
MWSKVTKDVTPLGSTPMSPVEQSIVLPATTPRAKPFRPVLDLHGLTLHDAYNRSVSHIANAAGKYRYVVIITGLSGQIREEFPKWFSNHALVRSINSLRGGGAWEVWLKKRDT